MTGSKINTPPVGVVIPTYNRADFLAEAVQSVISQKFADWELVIVDDGSTDNTQDVVKNFADSRIKYVRQENRGVSAARNLGVSKTAASIIAFLDSDDLWLSKKLETQLNFFNEHPDAAICQTEEIWIRNGRRVNSMKKHAKKSGWIFRDCLPLCIVSPSAVMMKRSVFDELGGFDEALPACEDYDLWLRAALRYEIHTLSEALIVKRGGHEDQLSRQWGLDRYRIIALEKILRDPCLREEHKTTVISEIERRKKIVAEGARKRNL